MKVVCISDTHNQLSTISVPDGDVLIHAGDATNRGNLQELVKFNEEMGKLPHPVKIFVPGNHDIECESNYSLIKNHIFTNITHYLMDDSITIDGVKFYGSPWQPEFCAWAFNLPRGQALRMKWDMIPDDTNVLITHSPPYGVLDAVPHDGPQGCQDLHTRIHELEHLKYHIFGHIHEGYGVKQQNGVTFINASSCTAKYRPVNKPWVFHLNE